MKVLHLSSSDTVGGAARAAHRLHRAMLHSGIDSRMRVGRKLSHDPTIQGPNTPFKKLTSLASSWSCQLPYRYYGKTSWEHHSNGRSLLNIAKEINEDPCDVVNLHWVNGGFLSIEAIGAINKPLIWTMHDMWPFVGGEHYTTDEISSPWREGYNSEATPPNCEARAWKYNCSIWRRKKRYFSKHMHMVGPSEWLADCARKSKLMKDWPVYEIPNTLDLDIYKPLDTELCRHIFNLPKNKPLLLVGALGGGTRKGFDLLSKAFESEKLMINSFDLITCGSDLAGLEKISSEITIHKLPNLNDDYSMAALYNCATAVVVPSRQENLGQMGTEAQSCGIPVIGFNTTGQPSVVSHEVTGVLCDAFDTRHLAEAIHQIISDSSFRHNMCTRSRERAQHLWEPRKVSEQYLEVYKSAIEAH